MDISQLSIKKDKNLIIPRLLIATTEAAFIKDITLVESVYNSKEIYTVLKSTR